MEEGIQEREVRKRPNSDNSKPSKLGKIAGSQFTSIGGKYYQIISRSAGTSSSEIELSSKHEHVKSTYDGAIRRTIKPPQSILTTSRPSLFVKTQGQKPKSIRNKTIENIEKSPHLYIGLSKDRFSILKDVISQVTKISLLDIYITLKKIRLNEDFNILSDDFELEEEEVKQIFSSTVVKLAKYMAFLVKWPDHKKYYDRHKNLPIAFRSRLSYVQSLVECIDTEFQPKTMHPHDLRLDSLNCNKLKFLLAMSPNGAISFISDMYATNQFTDDLTILQESNFRMNIPNYLSLVADPGKSVRKLGCAPSKHPSTVTANELQNKNNTCNPPPSLNSLIIKNGNLSTSSKDYTVPIIKLPRNICRMQIRNLRYFLADFKILQSNVEPFVYQYLNEILVIIAAVTNLQR